MKIPRCVNQWKSIKDIKNDIVFLKHFSYAVIKTSNKEIANHHIIPCYKFLLTLLENLEVKRNNLSFS